MARRATSSGRFPGATGGSRAGLARNRWRWPRVVAAARHGARRAARHGRAAPCLATPSAACRGARERARPPVAAASRLGDRGHPRQGLGHRAPLSGPRAAPLRRLRPLRPQHGRATSGGAPRAHERADRPPLRLRRDRRSRRRRALRSLPARGARRRADPHLRRGRPSSASRAPSAETWRLPAAVAMRSRGRDRDALGALRLGPAPRRIAATPPVGGLRVAPRGRPAGCAHGRRPSRARASAAAPLAPAERGPPLGLGYFRCSRPARADAIAPARSRGRAARPAGALAQRPRGDGWHRRRLQRAAAPAVPARGMLEARRFFRAPEARGVDFRGGPIEPTVTSSPLMAQWQRVRLTLVATGVALGGLLPVFGDPRLSPVTHAEGARLLLRGLGMGDVLAATGQASAAFAILSWKDSLAFRADAYQRADGVEVVGEGRSRRVVAGEATGEVAYALAVPRGGDYRLRLRLSGDPSHPAGVELLRARDEASAGSFKVAPTAAVGWVEGGAVHLDAGVYTAAVELPRGTSLEALEVAPPCVSAIEPPGGWRGTDVALNTDVAVTVLKAIDREDALPPSDLPVEVSGAAFQVTRGSAQAEAGLERLWLRAGPAGLEAVVFVDVPRDGLYAVSAFGQEGAGQSWLGDSCRKAVVCGSAGAAAPEARWRLLTTAELTAGRHAFSVALTNGASVERLRLERKRAEPSDYLETLRRLGFDAGPDGPVDRTKASEAVEFVLSRRNAQPQSDCGDAPATLVAQLQGAASGRTEPPNPPIVPPGPPGPLPPGPPPVTPPVVPPQPPASPVVP